MFSTSSVLPEDSRSLALSRGKQKEKAGAESGATSEEEEGEGVTWGGLLTSKFNLRPEVKALKDKLVHLHRPSI